MFSDPSVLIQITLKIIERDDYNSLEHLIKNKDTEAILFSDESFVSKISNDNTSLLTLKKALELHLSYNSTHNLFKYFDFYKTVAISKELIEIFFADSTYINYFNKNVNHNKFLQSVMMFSRKEIFAMVLYHKYIFISDKALNTMKSLLSTPKSIEVISSYSDTVNFVKSLVEGSNDSNDVNLQSISSYFIDKECSDNNQVSLKFTLREFINKFMDIDFETYLVFTTIDYNSRGIHFAKDDQLTRNVESCFEYYFFQNIDLDFYKTIVEKIIEHPLKSNSETLKKFVIYSLLFSNIDTPYINLVSQFILNDNLCKCALKLNCLYNNITTEQDLTLENDVFEENMNNIKNNIIDFLYPIDLSILNEINKYIGIPPNKDNINKMLRIRGMIDSKLWCNEDNVRCKNNFKI